jgi:hypothetical protein
LALSCAAGYVPLRFFTQGLRLETRLALTPLAGAATLAIFLLWIHVFVPLGNGVALAGLIPPAAGLTLFAIDAKHGRITCLSDAHVAATLFAVIGGLIILLPFFALDRPTSFGIINNDAFYYVSSDFLVQHNSYTNSKTDSLLAAPALLIRRYGINYLSTLVQSLTGLRSWEVLHLAGAFGLFLSMCAGYLLTRGLGAGPLVALVTGVVIGANHWIFRLYIEAVLAFMFGLAFLLASLWALSAKWPQEAPERSRIFWPALMFAGLAVFYFDLLPILIVLAGLSLAAGWLWREASLRPLLGLALGVVIALPVVHQAVLQFLLISGAPGPGRHFNLNDVPRTLLHFTGMMDDYDYIFWPGPIDPLQIAGSIAVVLLLAFGAWAIASDKQIRLFAAATLLPMAALFIHLFRQGREYHAHRVLCLLAVLFIAIVAAALSNALVNRRRLRLALAAVASVALLGASEPVSRLLNRFSQQNIIVTQDEKQIGDEWIPALPKSAVVFIDTAPTVPIFYSHYLYWEAVHGMAGDESRVLLPAVLSSSLKKAVPIGALDLSRVSHVLKIRNQPSLVDGSFEEIA